MLKSNYLINENTILLTGTNSRYGQLITMVIEGNKKFRVNITSEEIINDTLNKIGTNLRMVLEIAKANLGNVKMYPLPINSLSGLYFFPSKSPKRPDCSWFSLVHVIGAKSIGQNKTKVYLSHGHRIIIDCKLRSFDTKYRRAMELRRRIAEKDHCPITFYLEPRDNYQMKDVKKRRKSMLNQTDEQKDTSRGQNENG